ncbi:MAG: transglutaminase family protein [Cytophagales bacterium]|nr:transglutaminase family protein [Cytophagales bacterium]MDW8383257.1 transglutaminase family protein [Flammeovirgaceae bacterium]
MGIIVAISHKTRYAYERLVQLTPHIFRLRPAPHSRTKILSYSINIKPEKKFLNWQQDPFGNYLARVVFPDPVQELSIDVEVIADLTTINPFDFFVEQYAVDYPFQYDVQLLKELTPYTELADDSPAMLEFIEKIRPKQKVRTIDFLVSVNRAVFQEIAYNIRLEPGIQTCQETMTLKTGSCRDSAWLLAQIMRRFGIASRFVSGYLVQLTPDIKSLDGPSGPEKDFTDLHAWCEVYIPGAGWIGLDPTSGLFAAEGHIPLCCTPNPASAAPVTGGYYGEAVETEFTFSNTVTRIHEDPRVTKPFSETEWELINALGYKVDADLNAMDVRLTMGGEPTFVSIDDMESAQWNTDADGPQKRKLAGELILRLRDTFGKGGLLHYGQGKWYPGEPFPRWQLACYWRKDGFPMWHNPDLFAKDYQDYGFTTKHAQQFMNELCRRLAISKLNISEAYEDPLQLLIDEGNIPININPLKYNLKDDAVRQKLAKDLASIGEPVGYVLPLQWNYSLQRWQSCTWEFRRGNLFLIPGNSPIGLRLPLKALPWIAPEKQEITPQRSLFADLPPLQTNFREIVEQRLEQPSEFFMPSKKEVMGTYRIEKEIYEENGEEITVKKEVTEYPEVHTEYVQIIKTALCVEPRNGRLYVFMPPVSYLEHYLDLLAAIESTAEALQMPVLIEGYAPPTDYRIEKIVVAPDPGVIEVNIHPQHSWKELVNTTLELYEQARLCRLGTEKFMLDGRHTGTGGGNHITIGGPSPADSPLLRRPDLLRSLITYWQHHPGLSYLFSTAFVGPTSQAPRVDEGRDERLYELEIAFDELSRFSNPPFWLVDRLLRHLLVDLTGNTHRTEFCIDKLYNPDSMSGRLGILEMRGFDMPPHPKMSLVQMLLIRALIAWFWKQPYHHKLVRWGTELHDKFMYEHFVREDMRDVVEDLNRAGYPFRMEWLDAFFEFRFPKHGTVKVRDIEMEIRAAIEPWHVLGEELTSFGTARYVDSSVERIQVKVTGMVEERFVVTCNGRRIPMRGTGTFGEYVGGVRYRAWCPPSALHPTILPHSPLVFDIIDTWNGRSIGGCTYFVAHPGGRAYHTFPINSYEAESRRVSRFWDYNHTVGLIPPPAQYSQMRRFFPQGSNQLVFTPPAEKINPEYPYTLDLRRSL